MIRNSLIAVAASLLFAACPTTPPPPPIPDAGACEEGLVRCGEACVDPRSDALHCGGCEAACATEEACVEGACTIVCRAEESLCGTTCADLSNDPAHCGACNFACQATQVCADGRCGCPAGTTWCDGSCVDLSSTAEHCGACGVSCLGLPGAVSGSCNAGVCVPECAAGLADCNDDLTDGCELPTSADPKNCGGCGITCGALCGGGTCLSVELPEKTFYHVCARHGDGRVSCWGLNMNGQLGTGDVLNSSVPKFLPLTDVLEIATGEFHSCARTADGQTWCWGRNDKGQLGTGDTMMGTEPRLVLDGNVPLTGVMQLALTDASTCALLNDGRVKCWGSGQHGRLGDGAATDSVVPLFVALEGDTPIQGATQLAAGLAHVCALLADRTVWCWGRNNNGQLGMGDTTNRNTAELVPGLQGVDQIVAAGFRTCARIGGTAKCWGQNLTGQLGDGTTTQRNAPVDVLNLTTATQLSVAQNHGCALLPDGSAKCWGLNTFGQIGDGTTTTASTPVTVLAPGATTAWTGLRDIGAGGAHTCVVAEDQAVYCWGQNMYGQLGEGSNANAPTPMAVHW